MEIPISQLPPGDPRLVDAIVGQLKSKGIFDKFRKECLADVDTKPAFLNLRQRVDGQVKKFLDTKTWRSDLNKNQLRDGVRKNIQESGILDTGIDAIINQVVNPKIKPLILPLVEDTVYSFLQVEKPKREIQEFDFTSHPAAQQEKSYYAHQMPVPPPPLPPYSLYQECPPPNFYERFEEHQKLPLEKESKQPNIAEDSSISSESHMSGEIKNEHKESTHIQEVQPPLPDILPMETDAISSGEDDILARTSPDIDLYQEKKTDDEFKMEEDNAVDSFDSARKEAEAVTSAVKKLSLGKDDNIKSLSGSQEPRDTSVSLPLFDKSLDSISSNSSGLSLSPSPSKSASGLQYNQSQIQHAEGTNKSVEDLHSTQSTPLVDEKSINESISSENSKSWAPYTLPKEMPSQERITIASFGAFGGSESARVIEGASPVSADDSQGSLEKEDVLSKESVKSSKHEERSEGEISQSDSSSLATSPEQLKDGSSKSPVVSSSIGHEQQIKNEDSRKSSHEDNKEKEKSKSKERYDSKDGKHSKDKDHHHRSKSKSKFDDHYSHHDKDKHHRRDRDDDKDKDKHGKGHHHHHSGSSSRVSTTSDGASKEKKERNHEKSSDHKSHSHSKSHHSRSHSSKSHSSSTSESSSKTKHSDKDHHKSSHRDKNKLSHSKKNPDKTSQSDKEKKSSHSSDKASEKISSNSEKDKASEKISSNSEKDLSKQQNNHKSNDKLPDKITSVSSPQMKVKKTENINKKPSKLVEDNMFALHLTNNNKNVVLPKPSITGVKKNLNTKVGDSTKYSSNVLKDSNVKIDGKNKVSDNIQPDVNVSSDKKEVKPNEQNTKEDVTKNEKSSDIKDMKSVNSDLGKTETKKGSSIKEVISSKEITEDKKKDTDNIQADVNVSSDKKERKDMKASEQQNTKKVETQNEKSNNKKDLHKIINNYLGKSQTKNGSLSKELVSSKEENLKITIKKDKNDTLKVVKNKLKSEETNLKKISPVKGKEVDMKSPVTKKKLLVNGISKSTQKHINRSKKRKLDSSSDSSTSSESESESNSSDFNNSGLRKKMLRLRRKSSISQSSNLDSSSDSSSNSSDDSDTEKSYVLQNEIDDVIATNNNNNVKPKLKTVTIPLVNLNDVDIESYNHTLNKDYSQLDQIDSKNIIEDINLSESNFVNELFGSSSDDSGAEFEGFSFSSYESPSVSNPSLAKPISKVAQKTLSKSKIKLNSNIRTFKSKSKNMRSQEYVVLCDSSDSSDMEVSLVQFCRNSSGNKKIKNLNSPKPNDFEGFDDEGFDDTSTTADQKLRDYLAKFSFGASVQLNDFLSMDSEEEMGGESTVFFTKKDTSKSVIEEIASKQTQEISSNDEDKLTANVAFTPEKNSDVKNKEIDMNLESLSNTDSYKPFKKRKLSSIAVDEAISPAHSPKILKAEVKKTIDSNLNSKDIIMNTYSLLTPEEDRTSTREYEVDLGQRGASYSPLSPASDSSSEVQDNLNAKNKVVSNETGSKNALCKATTSSNSS